MMTNESIWKDAAMGQGGDKKNSIDIELDRNTFSVVLDNMRHFAKHYDDPDFIDKTATHATRDDVQDIVGLLENVDTSVNPVTVQLGYNDWCKFTDALYSAQYTAQDTKSADILAGLYSTCTDMEDNGTAPSLG